MFLLNFCIYFVFTSNGLKMYYLTKHTIVTKIVFIWGDRNCGKDKSPATGSCQVIALPDAGNLNQVQVILNGNLQSDHNAPVVAYLEHYSRNLKKRKSAEKRDGLTTFLKLFQLDEMYL